MSHQIDFKCHNTASAWNGHWVYGDLTWKLIKGKRPYLIDRQPLSTHLRLLAQHGFEVCHVQCIATPNMLKRRQLALQFQDMGEEDLTTSGAYILAVRIPCQGGMP
jgi:hypothetical protein